ncbi:MAG: polysaccharide deacetylase family protein [Pseudomonadota bacterium]
MKASVRYLASIHDVMPSKLDATEALFERLNRAGLGPVTLLVVPDTGWDEHSLPRLRALVEQGAELAGHGWCHRVETIRGIKHQLHSHLISRDVAEHLALDAAGAIDLMKRCHAWFEQHELPSPTLYVPPAWAMGSVSRAQLNALPFQQFETTGGVYDARRKGFLRLPMLGFEADTAFRALAVGAWNRFNQAHGRWAKQPIRLGIHPQDESLKLADALSHILGHGGEGMSYRALAA